MIPPLLLLLLLLYHFPRKDVSRTHYSAEYKQICSAGSHGDVNSNPALGIVTEIAEAMLCFFADASLITAFESFVFQYQTSVLGQSSFQPPRLERPTLFPGFVFNAEELRKRQ